MTAAARTNDVQLALMRHSLVGAVDDRRFTLANLLLVNVHDVFHAYRRLW